MRIKNSTRVDKPQTTPDWPKVMTWFSGLNLIRIPLKFADSLNFKLGFHIVVSVASVVRKKFIGLIEFILSRTKSCICRFFGIEHLYGRFP